jgi:sugar phosphate isomerase/epimerase
MRDGPIALGVTLGPLGPVPEALERAAQWGLAGVQFDAADPALRPRDLGESARRDLAATLRRRGLVASGIDCFVPVDRFKDPARVDRAVEAVLGCLVLSESLGRVPVCMHLPKTGAEQVRASLCAEAVRRGVPLADFTRGSGAAAVGVDPAATIAAGQDPVTEVHQAAGRVAAARVVDLLASGMRGPIGEPSGSRLDALAWRLALEMSGFTGLPVIDVRQWAQVREGVHATMERWTALLPAGGVGA